MSRFELGMTLDYVSNWSLEKAVNEIYQNALDEETVNPDNKMYFVYDKDKQELTIGNQHGYLPVNTLLLGASTKRDNDDLIGQHGEGYKVAVIVLLRNGKTLKIYNNNRREVWTAKTIKSRRYGCDVAVFDIAKDSIFSAERPDAIEFVIGGISEEEYDAIRKINLHLKSDINVLKSSYGQVILNDEERGNLYVNGLFICHKEQLNNGYNFKPSCIKLDRDRGLLDTWDVQYTLGKLILGTENVDFIVKMSHLWDGEYISSAMCWQENSVADNVCNIMAEKFYKKYGKDAVPVTTQDKYNYYKSTGRNAVLVSSNDMYYIENSTVYEPSNDVADSPIDLLSSWFEGIESKLDEDEVTEFNAIFEMLKAQI